jgi:hypothetical protein
MKRATIMTVLAIAAGVAVTPAFISSAEAQVPPRNGALGDRDRDGIPNVFDQHNNNRPQAWGDRDRDGVPNAYDRYDNRQQAWGGRDRDHDGVPNRYDRFDNRQMQDRDHDGVPRAFDRNDHNPWR